MRSRKPLVRQHENVKQISSSTAASMQMMDTKWMLFFVVISSLLKQPSVKLFDAVHVFESLGQQDVGTAPP